MMNRKFFRPLRIVHYAINRLGEERGAGAAAGMAFYSFFSLFPILLVLVAVGSSLLKIPYAETEIMELLTGIFPFSGELIIRNLEQVLHARGSAGALAIAALTWSGSGIFFVLASNINRAWPDTDQRAFLMRRLMAIVMLISLLIILLALSVLKHALPLLLSYVNGGKYLLGKIHYLSSPLIWVTLFAGLLILYRWIPNRQVPLDSGIWGGLVASVGLQGVTKGFGWYLRSGLARYNLVYGSLGAIAIFLFWIYISSYIVLFGTHLSAAVAHFKEKKGKLPVGGD